MMWRLAFGILVLSQSAWAEQNYRICIYGDNRGANPVERAILKQAKRARVQLFVINGDVLKYDYGPAGTPEAVLADYRRVFATVEQSLAEWPETPGPNVLAIPGGHDEQYFLSAEMAALADSSRGKRYDYEGTSELGTRLYDAFNLDFMRLRVQPFAELADPLPMSPYGDYLLVTGSGGQRECALLALYRTDRWAFREDQVDWIEAALHKLRAESPDLPLIVAAHDWMWFYPDSLDNGEHDGAQNGIRDGSPERDRQQKRRLFQLMLDYRVDLAVASDLHAYWAGADGGLLRVNCAAARCTDPRGQHVAIDNVWLEYSQTATTLTLVAHPIEPPVGCGLQPEAAAYGVQFEKRRAPGAVWRTIINP